MVSIFCFYKKYFKRLLFQIYLLKVKNLDKNGNISEKNSKKDDKNKKVY